VTLAETQALFHAAITGGPVAQGALEACFAGTPALPAAERVAIYAGMYGARLEESLAATFPTLRALLGCERFAALARAYLAAHPSEHHDIAQAGRRLPAFLRSGAGAAPGDRLDLADLAELEWLRQGAFFAAPAGAAGPEAFARLGPEDFASATLALAPALRIAWLEHDVTALWRALEAGEPPPPPEPGPTAVATWRTGFEVAHTRLDADEAVAVARAGAGESLGEVCQAFADREDPGAAAHAALSSWLAEGWILGLSSAGASARQPPHPAEGPGTRPRRDQRAGAA
jgi:hypothetical protein